MKSEKIDVKILVADPTSLGLFGLAMVTLVASSQKIGWTSGVSFVIPWAFMLGGIAQLIASMQDFKHNNTFGGVAFAGYGLFWIAMAFTWMIKHGVFGQSLVDAADGSQLAFAFLGYLIFSLFLTVATLELSKYLFVILVLIDILFLALMLDSFGIGSGSFHKIAAWDELFISITGFYGSAAAIINNIAGKVVLPMGKPFGILKKM